MFLIAAESIRDRTDVFYFTDWIRSTRMVETRTEERNSDGMRGFVITKMNRPVEGGLLNGLMQYIPTAICC